MTGIITKFKQERGNPLHADKMQHVCFGCEVGHIKEQCSKAGASQHRVCCYGLSLEACTGCCGAAVTVVLLCLIHTPAAELGGGRLTQARGREPVGAFHAHREQVSRLVRKAGSRVCQPSFLQKDQRGEIIRKKTAFIWYFYLYAKQVTIHERYEKRIR